MTFDKFNHHAFTTTLVRHQAWLRRLAVVLLSLYLLAFAARLVWQLVPAPEAPTAPTSRAMPTAGSSAGQRGVSVAQIQQLNLFGEYNATPQPVQQEVTDAPQTTLNLTLTGVVASSIVAQAAAIIENRGTQMVYGLGEKIEGTNVTLHQVQADRVIIENGSRHETLMLEGVDYDQANRQRQQTPPARPASRMTPSNAQAGRNASQDDARQLDNDAIEATNQLREQPASFTDFIAISPKTGEDGNLMGYQVQPGNKPTLFEAAGLKSGDIILQINGYDLTDTQQTMTAMNELRNAQSIELTLDRDGEYITVYLDMPEAGAE